MKKLHRILFLFVFLWVAAGTGFAQAKSQIIPTQLSQQEIDRILKNVTEKEGEFREALKNYVFNRSAIIQTIGLGGQVSGEFRRDSFLTFNSDGARFERVVFSPISTLTDLTITPEDLEDLGGVNPFALDPYAINQYKFNFIGKEKIDDLDLYVFDVSPKVVPDPKKSKQRLFIGRIWVDDRDLQIVKSKGKAIPETKDNKFPIVETWRENIDGKYWFPAYSLSTGSDGELVFDSGQVVRLRMRVKYTDYKQGRSDVKILDDVEEVPAAKPTPTPTPKKP